MLVAVPILLPLCVLTLLLLCWHNIVLKQIIHSIGLIVYLALTVSIVLHCWSTGYAVLNVGGFAPPFAITLVLDRFAMVMLLVLGVTSLLVGLYLPSETTLKKVKLGVYPAF